MPLGLNLHRGVAVAGAHPVLRAAVRAAAARRRQSTARHCDCSTAFYRAGALVFGGGHVVLPLLQAAVVPPGWVDQRRIPRRLRSGAGDARPAVHLRRLSRRGDDPAAQRRTRRIASRWWRSSRRRSCWSSALLPFWDTLRRGKACRPRCAASTPPWSACCSPRSIRRYGRAACTHQPASAWRISAFLALTLWAVSPWIVVVAGAVVASGVATLGFPL